MTTRHATRGVLYVHSAPSALCPHIEWATGGVLSAAISLEWTPQPAQAGAYRAEYSWSGEAGTAAAIASALLVNVGTVHGQSAEAMRIAVRSALHAPVRVQHETVISPAVHVQVKRLRVARPDVVRPRDRPGIPLGRPEIVVELRRLNQENDELRKKLAEGGSGSPATSTVAAPVAAFETVAF